MWHIHAIEEVETKTQQAGAFLKFILDALQNDNTPYAFGLKNEIHSLARHTTEYVLNDYLSPNNQAIYFYEFIDALNFNQMTYVSDAYLPLSYIDNLPENVRNQLKKINNIIYINQFIDFIRNQRFRASLVCHADQTINRNLKTSDIENYYIQLLGKVENEDIEKTLSDPDAEMVCTSPFLTIRSKDPNIKAALGILAKTRFMPMTYQKIAEAVFEQGSLKKMQDVHAFLNDNINLMQCALAGLIQVNTTLNPYMTTLSDKPTACPLARYFAKRQGFTTNRRHQVVALDPLSRMILLLLDGQHTKSDVIDYLVKEIQEKDLNFVDENKNKINDPDVLKEKVSQYCDQIFTNLSQQALLIA
jgi:methyltransferase-like protein